MLSTTEVLPNVPLQLLQSKYSHPTDREKIVLSSTEVLPNDPLQQQSRKYLHATDRDETGISPKIGAQWNCKYISYAI